MSQPWIRSRGSAWNRGLGQDRESIVLRFADRVLIDTECWLWDGFIQRTGYGWFWMRGRNVLAHRAAYELFVGPVPDGLQLDHLCRVRRCVNPSHLEPVTLQENTARGESLNAVNAAKSHCLRGHPFDERNTYAYQDPRGRARRICRECVRIRGRSYRGRVV